MSHKIISDVNSKCVKKVFQINRNHFLEAHLPIEKTQKWWSHFTKRNHPLWGWFVYLKFLVLSSSSNSILLLNHRVVCVGREPQESSSLALKWTAPVGFKPESLVLLAPCFVEETKCFWWNTCFKTGQ